jgi:polynucleotide 5'-kinase involved in rRNA processing
MSIEAPRNVMTRSQSDRREIRAAGYRRFLQGATTRTYPLNNVRLKPPKGLPSIQATLDFRNLIVGLLDQEGYLLQIGILLGLERDFVRVYARETDELREIELGHLKLSLDGQELGYFEL